MLVVGIYGLVNITFTKVTGSAVYSPVLTFDLPLSWTSGFMFLPLFAGVFYFEYWLTTLKLKRIYAK